MATLQEINSAISFGNFTNEDLDTIIQAIKYRRSQMAKSNIRSFWQGDNVKFVHPKTGRTHYGVVTKVNIKKIVVREGNSNWNVPANLLTAA